MKIIAHRGVWRTRSEGNTLDALSKAIAHGYGIETDIRDFQGQLVISHDIATDECIKVEEIFKIYSDKRCIAPIALNVKADGIQDLLFVLLRRYNISNYFMFDMSIPEMVIYNKKGLRFFTRHSDIEEKCVLYKDASGVWLDSFYDKDWLNEDIIIGHLRNNKRVCIISPEIHGYDEIEKWSMLKRINNLQAVMLCTDNPVKAEEFFNGRN